MSTTAGRRAALVAAVSTLVTATLTTTACTAALPSTTSGTRTGRGSASQGSAGGSPAGQSPATQNPATRNPAPGSPATGNTADRPGHRCRADQLRLAPIEAGGAAGHLGYTVTVTNRAAANNAAANNAAANNAAATCTLSGAVPVLHYTDPTSDRPVPLPTAPGTPAPARHPPSRPAGLADRTDRQWVRRV